MAYDGMCTQMGVVRLSVARIEERYGLEFADRTLNVLQAARDAEVGLVVHTSTS
jgi:hypothetical protein